MSPLKHARPPGRSRREPYSTAAVVAVVVATALVPLLAVCGYGRLAVTWLGIEVLVLACVRVARPDGTWIAARGRAFDVAFGLVLGVALLVLSWYATLPSPASLLGR